LSRRGLALLTAPLLFIGSIAGGHAQEATKATEPTDAKVEGMVDRAKATYGPAAPQRPKACGKEDKNGEIVVCAPDDGKQWRVPSTSQDDPTSRQATRTGVPRAPQLDRGSCKGKGQLGCIGIGGKGHEIYMIDLKSIPETPKDSDAEKVAKGEMSDR
jgi:hypothetical protein